MFERLRKCYLPKSPFREGSTSESSWRRSWEKLTPRGLARLPHRKGRQEEGSTETSRELEGGGERAEGTGGLQNLLQTMENRAAPGVSLVGGEAQGLRLHQERDAGRCQPWKRGCHRAGSVPH